MKKSYLSCLGLGALALLISGCTMTVGYNPSYLPAEPLRMNIAGKSLVVMSDADAAWVCSTKPTSFTGGGNTLSIPIGEITKQVALKVFGAAFKDGAEFRSSVQDASGYRLVVKPKVNNCTYAFNQLKNLGFAITPTVTMELHVELTGPDGKVVLDKTYVSGPVEGASYAASLQPMEKINELIHSTLFKLMTNAAEEVKGKL